MLVGRESECGVIDRALVGARAGRSSTIVLIGDAGIGKTTLLEYAARAATGCRTLRACGRENEARLPFAGLFDLFRPVLDKIEQLPGPQAAALAGALALGPPVPGDRFTVAAATLNMLAAAAEDEPALALIDDGQWLDPASREALLFAARRVAHESVVVLIAVREGETAVHDLRGLDQLRVPGLGAVDARTMLDAQAGTSIASELASKLWRATGGNPLAMLEVVRLLTADQISGREQVEVLPSAVTVEEAFLRRVDRLPCEARQALLVAAAAGAERRPLIADACRALRLPEEALDAAERDGLVIAERGGLRFYHPLVASAVYRAASHAERREAHRALAHALVGDEWARERAWHESEATVGPDESVASGLEREALVATQQNAPELAARSFERAAHHSVSARERGRRLFQAAEQWQLVGRSETALALIEESLRVAAAGRRQTEIEELRARAEAGCGRVRAGSAILLREAARVEQRDPATAVRLMSDGCMLTWMAGDFASAASTAKHCYAIGERVGGEIGIWASLTFGCSLLFQGERRRAAPLLLGAEPSLAADAPLIVVQGLGQILVWLEEHARAAAWFDAFCSAAWAANAPSLLGPALARRSRLRFQTGNWAAAYADTVEALRLAEETGQPPHYALAFGAQIEAARGEARACEESTRRALEYADRFGIGSAHGYVLAALGHLELALGRPDEAIGQLVEVKRLLERWELRDPGVVEAAPDLIEAYARAGHVESARAEIGELERAAARTGNVNARAAALRYQGLVTEDGDVDALFLEALETHSRLARPFERARTELCYGERLRRARRKSDAREHLQIACGVFEQLGARPWAERARSELRALGIRVPRAAARRSDELTPQELRVALAVSDGATNREASAALFLSPKTIEAHLSRVYRKLGVRSRTELATLLAREGELLRGADRVSAAR